MTSITVLRPDQDPPPATTGELAVRGPLPAEPVAGVVVNGKPLARELLELVVDELGRRVGRTFKMEQVIKPSASAVLSAEQADVLAVRCHLVISGLGD